MTKPEILNQLKEFETRFDYDMTYVRELLDTDLDAYLTFARIEELGRYRKDVPADVLFAAKLVAALGEDCGPCTQLNVTMALQSGVTPQTIAAVIEGDEARMTEEVRLAVAFARATNARDTDADDLRDAIERRWGKRAVASLAFGMAVARVYPTIKYALGHGRACTRLVVDGRTVIPQRAPEAAAHVLRASS